MFAKKLRKSSISMYNLKFQIPTGENINEKFIFTFFYLEDDFDERCEGQCSIFESDDILMPRIEYFLYKDLYDSQAETVYKKLLKLNLFSQEKIADEDEACVAEGANSFVCSEACVQNYQEGIIHLERNLQKNLGRCRFWQRKFQPVFDDIKRVLNLTTPGKIPLRS